jgi:hypothetical protein
MKIITLLVQHVKKEGSFLRVPMLRLSKLLIEVLPPKAFHVLLTSPSLTCIFCWNLEFVNGTLIYNWWDC